MKISLCLHTERTNVETSYETAYQHFVELCKQGDSSGFYTIWTGEHHAMDFAISPNPLLTIAALSSQIHSARLGTATIVTPFWHPIRLAGEIAFTNQITNGRLEVGLSKGAFQYEYDRLTGGVQMHKLVRCYVNTLQQCEICGVAIILIKVNTGRFLVHPSHLRLLTMHVCPFG